MIGKHCGEVLVRLNENRYYFRKRCSVCGRTFKQGKRQKKEVA